VNSPTELTVATPPHAAGTVAVRVTTAYGASGQSDGAFTFG
jgi:hypothetical protein